MLTNEVRMEKPLREHKAAYPNSSMGHDDHSFSSCYGGDADRYDQQSCTAISCSFCCHEKRAEVRNLVHINEFELY
jgi:hypothetical protein